MKYTITLDHLPSGYSIDTADEGESVTIAASAFITAEHGGIFYKILQSVENQFLSQFLGTGMLVSQIDHFLVLMKNNEATVYVNELSFVIETIAQRALQAGELGFLNDMLGVRTLSFPNLSIPDDHGIAFFFSVDWRRGFYFDFQPNTGAKLENIYRVLGSHYETLLYDKLYGIDSEIWKAVFDTGWFPFLSLIGQRQIKFERFVARIREGKTTDFAETELIDAFGEDTLKAIKERLRQNSLLNPHILILEAGIERYQHQDYISCISNIWSRLEGILRYVYSGASNDGVKKLLNNMEAKMDASWQFYPGIYFPKQFKDYLKSYYFHDFDLSTGQLQISRHSIGHGVSNQTDYDRKRALIGILIADQLGYYISIGSKAST